MFIDLDEGRLLTPPEGLSREEGPVLDWCRSAGIDAMCETSTSVRGLVCFDMVVHPINEAIWRSNDARFVTDRELLVTGTPGNPVFMSAKGDLPATYVFRTRESGMGVLQIVAFNDNPRGVKVRYKMLQRSAPDVGTSTGVRTDSESAARLAELRIRLAHVEAALRTKEAELQFAEQAMVRAEVLFSEGRTDTASLDRGRLDLTRARAELQAAKSELQILTAELARLEAGRPNAAGLAELRLRLADAKAEVLAKDAALQDAMFPLKLVEADPEKALGEHEAEIVERNVHNAKGELEAAQRRLQILTEEFSRVRQEQERGARALDHARGRAGQAAERARILQALRSTGVAVAMYRSDHDGAFPPDLDALAKVMVNKDALPSAVRPDLQWRFQEPETDRPDEVILYHWPPVDRQVALLYQDTGVAWAPVGEDGVLRNPRSGKVITTATQAVPNAAGLADLRSRLAEAEAEVRASTADLLTVEKRAKSLAESVAAGQAPQADLDAAKRAAIEAQARVSAAFSRVEELKKAISLLEGATAEVPTAADVARRFVDLLRSGQDDGELLALTVPDTIRDPGEFLPKLREYFDLAGVTIQELWIADEDACALTCSFPAREGERNGALGIGLRKHGNRWLVRDIDALPTEQARQRFVQGFRDAYSSARQVPLKPLADKP